MGRPATPPQRRSNARVSEGATLNERLHGLRRKIRNATASWAEAEVQAEASAEMQACGGSPAPGAPVSEADDAAAADAACDTSPSTVASDVQDPNEGAASGKAEPPNEDIAELKSALATLQRKLEEVIVQESHSSQRRARARSAPQRRKTRSEKSRRAQTPRNLRRGRSEEPSRTGVTDAEQVTTAGATSHVLAAARGGAKGLVAGSAVGAGSGLVFAPFTLGLSIPVGVWLGASAGTVAGAVVGGVSSLRAA